MVLAMPMYLALGSIAGTTGIVDRISDWVVSIVGRMRGGLGVAVVITNGIFGAVSGVAMAALAGIGRSLLPVLERNGYPKNYSIALLISSAVLALLIPPSGNMIIYGFMGQLSISMCFLAPLIPGLILIFLLSATNMVLCRNIPTIVVPPKANFKARSHEMWKTFRRASLGLVLPFIVLGGIYAGLYTPIEAAAFGVFYALCIGFFVYRNFTPKILANQLLDIGIMMGSIACLFIFFLVISRIFIIQRVSDQMLAYFYTISDNRWFIMGCLNVLMLFMGMIIDDASGVMIAAVVLLPIVRAIGFDPFHFAAIVGVNLGMGLITPPVAPLLYLGEMIAEIPVETFIKRTFYYIIFAYIPTLVLTIAKPELSTYLPYLVAGVARG